MAMNLLPDRRIARIDLSELGSARRIDLRGRGSIWIREIEGPPQAPTLLLLHGLLATGDVNWGTSFAELQQHFRIVAVDHHGHGRGNRTRASFQLERCADDIAALCRHLDIERPVVCGYSMGGPIAALLWRRHPDLVAGLVFAATVRRFNGNFAAEKLGLGALTGLTLGLAIAGRTPIRVVSRAVIRQLTPRRSKLEWMLDGIERHDPIAILQAIAAIIRYDSRDWISDVDVPTTVLVTTHDRLLAPWRQHVLADSIPHAERIETSGTHLVILRDGTSFPRDVTAACRSVAARAGLLDERNRTAGRKPRPINRDDATRD